jgi:hypothetical protein
MAAAPPSRPPFDLLASLAELGTSADSGHFGFLLNRAWSLAKVPRTSPCSAAADAFLAGAAGELPRDAAKLASAGAEGALDSNVGNVGNKPMNDEEAAQRDAVWTWFTALSVDERDRVFTVVDKPWVSLLLRMHTEVKRKGQGVFCLGEEPSALPPTRSRRESFSGCVPPPVCCCAVRFFALLSALLLLWRPCENGCCFAIWCALCRRRRISKQTASPPAPEFVFRSWRILGKSSSLSR